MGVNVAIPTEAGSQCGYPNRGLEVNVDIPTEGWKSMWLSQQRAGSQCGYPNRGPFPPRENDTTIQNHLFYELLDLIS